MWAQGLTMTVAVTASVATLLCLSTCAASATTPAIETDGGAMTLSSDSITFSTSTDTVTVKGLLADINFLREQLKLLSSTCITQDDLNRQLAAATTGVLETTGRLYGTKDGLAAVTQRAGQVEDRVAAVEGVVDTVGELAQDMGVLLRTVSNITACHGAAQLHSGDGECISPIPLCTQLPALKNGLTTHPSSGTTELVPGAGYHFACNDGFFLGGSAGRVCLRNGTWSGDEASCTSCKVKDCIACKKPGTCLQCQPDQRFDDVTGNCLLSQAIYVIGGHQRLTWEKMDYTGKWTYMLPDIPSYDRVWGPNPSHTLSLSPTVGMIKGHIFYVQYIGKMPVGTSNMWTLAPRGSKWVLIGAAPIQWYDANQGPQATVINDEWYLLNQNGQATKYTPDFKQVPGAGAWTSLPRIDGALRFGATAAAHTSVGNKWFLSSGRGTGIVVLDTKAVVPAWSNKDVNSNIYALPRARQWHSMVGIRATLYVFGGKDPIGGKDVLEVDALDLSAGTWSTKAPLPHAMSNAGAALYENRIWFVGGSASWGVSTTTPLIYDPTTGKWSEGKRMLVDRKEAGVVVGLNLI